MPTIRKNSRRYVEKHEELMHELSGLTKIYLETATQLPPDQLETLISDLSTKIGDMLRPPQNP